MSAEGVIWLLLALASVTTLALAFDGCAFGLQLRRRARRRYRAVHVAQSLLRRAAAERDAETVARCRHELQRLHDPLAELYRWLLEHAPHDDAEQKARMLLEAAERGRLRLARFLTRVSPLLGLAGTVLGVQRCLADYSNGAASQEAVVTGFAFALGTTLYGIAIAIAAYVTATMLLEPLLRNLQQQLGGVLVVCRGQEGAAR